MTNNLINGGGGTSGACRMTSSSTLSSILVVIVLLCIQVRGMYVFSVASFTYYICKFAHFLSPSNFGLEIAKVGNTCFCFIFSYFV